MKQIFWAIVNKKTGKVLVVKDDEWPEIWRTKKWATKMLEDRPNASAYEVKKVKVEVL